MNILFWIGIIFILVVPVYIGVSRKTPSSTVWAIVVCGALVIFMSKIEIIQEFSLGPLKAKMKDQIREADATIKQLKEISAVSSEATLTNLMAGSFMAGMTLEKRLELHDKIIGSLKEIGVSQYQIDKVESDWGKGISIIYYRTIKNAVEQRKNPNEINPAASEEAQKAGHEIENLLDIKNWAAPTPQQIRNVIEKYNIKSPEAEEWIRDYEHYLKTGEMRNREKFVQFN